MTMNSKTELLGKMNTFVQKLTHEFSQQRDPAVRAASYKPSACQESQAILQVAHTGLASQLLCFHFETIQTALSINCDNFIPLTESYEWSFQSLVRVSHTLMTQKLVASDEL